MIINLYSDSRLIFMHILTLVLCISIIANDLLIHDK